MLFVILGHDGPRGAELRPSVRTAHLKNLQPLVDSGKIIIAGPFTDGSGSMLVVDMDNEAQVKAFMDTDPYVIQGVFERVEIKPFRRVFPE
jgi:uncharacterized protein YciI